MNAHKTFAELHFAWIHVLRRGDQKAASYRNTGDTLKDRMMWPKAFSNKIS
jgi:hypothetical protein